MAFPPEENGRLAASFPNSLEAWIQRVKLIAGKYSHCESSLRMRADSWAATAVDADNRERREPMADINHSRGMIAVDKMGC